MVKGVSRRVIIVKAPDPRLFEQAIFIVREDAATQGVSAEQVLSAVRPDTALVSVIGMPDLMQRARSFASQSYAYFEAYTVVALVYLIITLLLSKIVSVIEARLNYYDRRK